MPTTPAWLSDRRGLGESSDDHAVGSPELTYGRGQGLFKLATVSALPQYIQLVIPPLLCASETRRIGDAGLVEVAPGIWPSKPRGSKSNSRSSAGRNCMSCRTLPLVHGLVRAPSAGNNQTNKAYAAFCPAELSRD